MPPVRRVHGPDDYLQSEAPTLAGILLRLRAEGYDAHFGARPGGTVVCFSCRAEVHATRLDVRDLRRLEGASDPADMLAVVALRCAHCGAQGTLVLGFGPEAALEDAEVLTALPDPPGAPSASDDDIVEFVTPPSPDFPFRTDDPLLALLSRCAGAGPERSRVQLRDGALIATYGPWVLRTPLTNVVHAEVTGPFSPWKVGGPARLSLADRGLTFATSRIAGVCIVFRDPVPGIEPFGRLRHPNLTVTVERPQALCRRLLDAATP